MAQIEENESTYTLPELVGRWGVATESEVLSFVGGKSKVELTEIGSDVVTTRIDKDVARMLGTFTDFHEKATEAQLDQLPGVSADLVRCAIFAARQASIFYETREAQRKGSKAAQDRRIAEATQKIEDGAIRRAQLKAALEALSGQDSGWLSKITSAFGTAPDPQACASSIESLVAVGKAMRDDATPAMVERIKKSRLTKAFLDGSATLAGEVRAAADVARATLAATPVAQADVDYWDGMALTLLDLIVENCEAGHRADPTIPRLVPIALRNWFSPKRKKKGAEAPKGGGEK